MKGLDLGFTSGLGSIQVLVKEVYRVPGKDLYRIPLEVFTGLRGPSQRVRLKSK